MTNSQYIKPNCPFCGSVQVKAMARQPKKYPKPADPEDLNTWQYGFDCKKCGSEFVVDPSAPAPAKSMLGGLIAWLIKIGIGIVIILMIIGYFAAKDKNPDASKTGEPDAIEKLINEKEQESNQPAVEMPSPAELNDTFSPEAEAAAHGEYDDPTPVAVERPATQTYESENLTITETIHQ